MTQPKPYTEIHGGGDPRTEAAACAATTYGRAVKLWEQHYRLLRTRRWLVFLKGPKCPALFSEREGFHRVVRFGGGWRLVVKDLVRDGSLDHDGIRQGGLR